MPTRDPLGPRGLAGRRGTGRRCPSACGRPGLPTQRAPRRRGASLPPQRRPDGARTPRRRCAVRVPVAGAVGVPRAAARPLGNRPSLRRRQIHARAPRLAEPDGDGLLRRSRAVFAPADLADLLTYKLTRLAPGALTPSLVPAGSTDGTSGWHCGTPCGPRGAGPARTHAGRAICNGACEAGVKAGSICYGSLQNAYRPRRPIWRPAFISDDRRPAARSDRDLLRDARVPAPALLPRPAARRPRFIARLIAFDSSRDIGPRTRPASSASRERRPVRFGGRPMVGDGRSQPAWRDSPRSAIARFAIRMP
jgi:hypothetical protein